MTDVTGTYLAQVAALVNETFGDDHILRPGIGGFGYLVHDEHGHTIGWVDLRNPDPASAVRPKPVLPKHPLADMIATLTQGQLVEVRFRSSWPGMPSQESVHRAPVTIEDFQVSLWPGPVLRYQDGEINRVLTEIRLITPDEGI
jgi:hypothetical protein